MKRSILLSGVLTLLAWSSHAQVVIDIDGNVYDTIHIGTQIWTRPNLMVTHYRNGDPIPNVTDSVVWNNLTSGAYCNYDNDTNIAAVYGRLYNWYAVHDSRNIAPPGWHVATYEDWDTLQIFLGYDLVAGGKLKEIGTAHWMSPNVGATDEYDFTALPGGQRTDPVYGGIFTELTQQAYWWTSSEMDTIYPWGMNISYNSEGFTNWAASQRKAGFSVRMICDVPLAVNELNLDRCFNIYPNPAVDVLFIADACNFTQTKVFVYDLFGNLVLQQVLTGFRTAINIDGLAPGMYVVKLERDEMVFQRKFVKN